jgi:WD40 repeat protein
MVGIHGLAFSPRRPWSELGFPHRSGEGEVLAIGANDSILEIWDPTTRQQVRTLPFPEAGGILGVAFSSDAKLIAAAGGPVLKVWSVGDGRLLHTFKGGHRLSNVVFSSDGLLVAASGETVVTVWSLADEESKTFGAPNSAAIFDDSRLVTIGSSQAPGERFDINRPYAIRVWDVQTGNKLKEFVGESPRVISVQRVASSTLLVWGENWCAITHSSCNDIQSWNLISGSHERLPAPVSTATAGTLCPDGHTVLAGFNNGKISLSNRAQGPDFYQSDSADANAFLESAACNDDSSLFAASEMRGRTFLWRNGPRSPIATLSGVIVEVESLNLLSTNHLISGNMGANYSYGYTESLTDWDLVSAHGPDIRSASLPVTVNSERGVYAWLEGPNRTPNGAHLTIGTTKGEVQTGIVADRGSRMAFSKSGKLLAIADDKKLSIWETVPAQKIYDLPSNAQYQIENVSFGAGDNTLVSAGGDGTATIWDLHNRKERCSTTQLHAPEHTVWAVAMNHAGVVLAWGGNDQIINLSDVNTCQTYRSWSRPDTLGALSFSPDDKLLASAWNDGVIDLWNLSSDTHVSVSGHLWSATSLSFNPTGTILASGSWDGTSKLWDVATGQQLVTIITFADLHNWAAVTPEGLFDASADGIKNLFWRVGHTNEIIPLDTYFGDYYHPGLIPELYSGGRPKPIVDLASRLRFPSLRVLGAAGIAHVETQNGDWFLCLRKPLSDNEATVTQIYPRGGDPVLPSAESFSRDDSRSDCAYRWSLPRDGAPYSLNREAPDKRPPLNNTSNNNLFVFTVGITEYETDLRYKINGTYPQLPFAAADADLVDDFFKKESSNEKKSFTRITVLPGLRNHEATLRNIRESLASIAQKAQPGDVVMLFFAGHGVVQPGEEMFDFIPYIPPPTDLLTAPVLNERDIGFNTAMLADAIRNLPTSNVIVVIDACQSGGALESLQNIAKMEETIYKLRNSANNAIVASEQPGLFLISAATPIEEAAATDKLQHGILSSVLLDAFRVSPRVTAWDVMTTIRREVPARAAQQGWSQTSLATHVGADLLLINRGTH